MSAADLANLLDALADTSVYVIEEATHRLLYYNRRCQENSHGKALEGAKCHEVWPEVCSSCPLKSIGEKGSNHIVCYNPILKTTVDITASRILWEEHIEAVVITSTPHRMNFEEEQGLRKIEQMYAQSLVTVFGECIIANLTSDYYVNCQKDSMWTEIPEQGNFGTENQKYASVAIHPDDLELFNSHFSRQAMLRLFSEGREQIVKRLRRLTSDGAYHMVEFTATRIRKWRRTSAGASWFSGYSGGISAGAAEKCGDEPAGNCRQEGIPDADCSESDAEFISHAGVRQELYNHPQGDRAL